MSTFLRIVGAAALLSMGCSSATTPPAASLGSMTDAGKEAGSPMGRVSFNVTPTSGSRASAEMFVGASQTNTLDGTVLHLNVATAEMTDPNARQLFIDIYTPAAGTAFMVGPNNAAILYAEPGGSWAGVAGVVTVDTIQGKVYSIHLHQAVLQNNVAAMASDRVTIDGAGVFTLP